LISKRDLIEIIERKIEEVVKKKQQLESIETYLIKAAFPLDLCSGDKRSTQFALERY
jgi:hypothetical protein